jgi:UDP-glucose 4-epimerase
MAYSDAYPAGFEDMQRRVPDITKAKSALNWKPTRNLDQIISDVAKSQAENNSFI